MENDAVPAEEWTVRQCADHLGVKPGTWRSYVARSQAPKPTRHLDQRTPLWSAAEVRAWQRPGRGARTDLTTSIPQESAMQYDIQLDEFLAATREEMDADDASRREAGRSLRTYIMARITGRPDGDKAPTTALPVTKIEISARGFDLATAEGAHGGLPLADGSLVWLPLGRLTRAEVQAACEALAASGVLEGLFGEVPAGRGEAPVAGSATLGRAMEVIRAQLIPE